jgi:hypothetical protein
VMRFTMFAGRRVDVVFPIAEYRCRTQHETTF